MRFKVLPIDQVFDHNCVEHPCRVFKQIVDGRLATLRAPRKHRDPIEFQPFTRLLASASRVPRSADNSISNLRRWLVVPFDPNLENDHIVAADGSVIRGYPGYQSEVRRSLQDILGPRAERIQIVYLRDGSGLGAAVVAAVAADVST